MGIPYPTPIYRIIHISNLEIYLKNKGLHAPNYNPGNELKYKPIHSPAIQQKRKKTAIKCGPKGVMHDYVPFYFGTRTPMLYLIHKGKVESYSEGQEQIIYLVSNVQLIEKKGLQFVFSDGHGISRVTEWYDQLSDLNKIDWKMVQERYWKETDEDPDRKRRKQAEFLVYKFCPWDLILEIGVINEKVKKTVTDILNLYSKCHHPIVNIHPEWYY